MSDRTPSPNPSGADANADAETAIDDTDAIAERETRLRERHPHVGEFLEAMQEPGPIEAAHRVGNQGDIAVATSVDERMSDHARPLHNRQTTGGQGEIEHVAVAPSGVYVINIKNDTGVVGIDRLRLGSPQLQINGEDRSHYLDELDRQVQAVRDALLQPRHSELLVQGVICFTLAELPLQTPIELRGHLLTWRRDLAKRLNAPGPLDPEATADIHRALAAALPPA